MSEFRDRMALIQRIIELCRLAQEGKSWARAEMKMELARLKEAYPYRVMTPEELARRMGEANRRQREPRTS